MKKNTFNDTDFTAPRINLLSNEDNRQPRGKKVFRISRFIIYLFTILILAFFAFSYQILITNNSLTDVFSGKVNIFQQLNILAGDGSRLQGEADDRINLLMLGMGGAEHDGPYLTDTMILLSIQPSTKKVAMISIPRDLLVEIPGYGWWKINNANSFGETQNKGNGGALSKEVVQNILNVPIHYYVRVDFSGFEQMIDTLDGVKVNVEKSFTDYQYPTDDYKYQIISFDEGPQTMDGDIALKYARSRHGNNGEGSDFARSKRQQKVMQAFKQRVLSKDFFLSPRKISNLSKDLAEHLRTDLEPWEVVKLAQLIKAVNTDQIINHVLDDSPGGYLYANFVNSAYVLQPRGDDFSQIQALAKDVFATPASTTDAAPVHTSINIEIKNGTAIVGLASRHSQELKLAGYRVLQVGNAPIQNYSTTEIYKLSGRDLPEETIFLEKQYKTTIIKNTVPDWIKNIAAPDLDFFIILGTDSETKPN
ncbi:MAG: Cell envelope-related transcriptional attenuator [Parcubacteria group bacterium GW2011_GWC2_39_14]|nr:MAG: Cell envelope-related transcriptional attenuator [Parcubacteria group bacterium GW2011_GWC2_39_14]KKR54926.1 MAG: Cell envelope-related transcriptional attenuator [Parcubacteria group bacterium GW2011_GWA2_40_23]